MTARQFSSHQEHYPSRSGGTLGADRKAATALIYQDVVAGVASTVAIQGDEGDIIAIQASALNTDNVIFNAATVYVAALGGGMIYVEESDYNLADTWNVSIDIFIQGAGWDAILNYNAGGNCITVTGDNVKIRDLKIIIVAGAGVGGTRPNGMLADTRTNIEIFGVWIIGDETVADDGSEVRQCGIVFDDVTESKITLCKLEDHRRQGTTLTGTSTTNIITKNHINSNLRRGIRIDTSSNSNIINENVLEGNGIDGIQLSAVDSNIFKGNICSGNTERGIRLDSGANENNLIGNLCDLNTQSGILLATGSNNNIVGNQCLRNVQHGIRLLDADNNNVIGNQCNENDSGDTGSFDGIFLDGDSDDNVIHSNICNANDRYGINVSEAACNDNWVKNNQLQGNTTTPFNDAGTGTKLATAPIQLIQGTTFISVAGSAWGWEIDADTEFALGIGWLPLELQQVVRIRIIAVGLATPGAGNEMRAQFTGEAATFDEVYTTQSIDVVDLDSEETNFAINDVIHWILDPTNDADIANILGGDRLQLKVLHEGAGGGSIETDAVFDSIQVEYV